MEKTKKNDLPVISKIQKNDFVEIKFSGYANGQLFDSNIAEDLKKISPKEQERQTVVVVGQAMLVPGLDKALEGKEIGKDYDVKFGFKDGFGERKRDLMKIIPLKIFTEKNIAPKPGMAFALDDSLVRIIAVSGARVTVDFNNPMAGKDLEYKFKIVRKVEDEKEKATVILEMLFRFKPDFEIKDGKVVIKGKKGLDMFVKAFNEKFKEIMGKELGFEEIKEEKGKEIKKEEHSHEGHDHSEHEHEHSHEGHDHSGHSH